MAWGGATPTMLSALAFQSANQATYTIPASGSLTLTSGRLYYIVVHAAHSSSVPDLNQANTLVGNSDQGSFTPVYVNQCGTYDAADPGRMAVWRYIPSENKTTVTFTFDVIGLGSLSCVRAGVVEIASGFDSTTPETQSAINAADDPNPSQLAVNLASAPASDALSLLFASHMDNTELFDTPSGWTELGEVQGTGGTADSGSTAIFYDDAAQNVTVVTNPGSTTNDLGGIHIEVKAGTSSTTLTPSSVAAAFAVVAPTLIKGAVSLAPAAVAAVFSVATPTVANVKTLTPAPVVMAASVAAPTVQAGVVTLTPSPVTGAWSVAAPTLVKGAVTLTPSPASAAYSVAAPSVASGVTLSPTPVAATWSVAAPTVVRGAVTLTPSATAAVWSVAAPTVVQGGGALTPTPVAAAWNVQAPTVVRGAISVTPSPVAAALAVATPSVLRGALLVTPAPIAAAFTVATPSLLKGARTITPSAVAATFSVATPTVISGTLATLGRPPYGATVTSFPFAVTLTGAGTTASVGTAAVTVEVAHG